MCVTFNRSATLAFAFSVAWACALGCSAPDPAERMIRQVDAMPPDKRPPNWERTRALMMRPAPRVGDLAPDFTLQTLEGTGSITRSTFHPDRPLVLIFGSFT
ncbi:MAG: hypothetical protein HY763_10385 [Planctomycetes bacterium]|nr:hypothetical protein [Planctomycetota bacterium]